ncbi:LuxR C-terminal-related transcriptional regulator [Roseovarius sp. EL26]|uniref:helix-turn-helix transcriptional regulator n=1 Tax=Roseovarius sp. EL26 TaxID=2126672 RepID=UPI0013C45D6A|nr:LuxR C-terminal-related transcriptional regulator [Roseovarius sp. EL26]
MFLEELGEEFGGEWFQKWAEFHILATVVMAGLLFTLGVLWKELHKFQKYHETLEDKMQRASTAFEDLLNAYFDKWLFSEAEQHITRLMFKGCSISEIAEIRGAKEGTIKAQTNSIYRKSGYSNKVQLLSAFLEDLTNGESVSGPH